MKSLAFEIRERIFKGDRLIFDSGFYSPNQLTNEGQTSILNVWARAEPAPDMWLLLLNNPGEDVLDKTATLLTVDESAAPGTSGYERQQILPGDWSEPVLDDEDMMLSSPQKMFGPFDGNVPVSHVGVCSVENGTAGDLFLFISTAYHNQNLVSRTFVSGESYQVLIRDKVI